MTTRPRELSGLPDRYLPLFDRVVEVCASDDRVRAVWLHGACGRGAADAGSDLDLSVAVRDADFDGFADRWREWLAAIAPTVVARSIGPGSFYWLTPTCERLDVVATRVSDIPDTGATLRRRVVVFDKDGLDAVVPAPDDPGPDRARIAWLIEETIRQQANWPVVHVREDWLLGQVGVLAVHQLLYELFTEANKPMPGTGPKQWSAKRTAAQRAVLAGLPLPAADAASVDRARAVAIGAFLREARTIASATGVTWPTALETAVRDYLATQRFTLGQQ
ncbi:MAG TPA: nucleotidyltransferase domain-containing protein [Pseudonocardiaceae bacterium]|nr:nucleotidyltransferase domain-containing protein [Pseudonocardiaceae bacterium]